MTRRSIRPSRLKSPGVQPIGAMVLSMGSGAGFSTNGANWSAAGAVGAYVTTTWLVLVSTMHRLLALPCPVKSLSAMPAPTEETHALMCS